MRIDGHAFDRTWFHITLQDSRGCIKYYWLLPAHDFDLANAHRSQSLISYREEIASKESDFLGIKCPCMYICIYFLHRRYRPKLVWENEAQSSALISHLLGVGRDYQLQTTDIHTTVRMQWIAKFQCLKVSCCKQEGKESNVYLF